MLVAAGSIWALKPRRIGRSKVEQVARTGRGKKASRKEGERERVLYGGCTGLARFFGFSSASSSSFGRDIHAGMLMSRRIGTTTERSNYSLLTGSDQINLS